MNPDERERMDLIMSAVHHLLHGRVPREIDLEGREKDEIGRLGEFMNRLIIEHKAMAESALSLSRGDIETPMVSRLPGGHSLKNLQASLRHLVWQTRQVADGDFKQRVEFLGDFSESFNRMAERLDTHHRELQGEILERRRAEEELLKSQEELETRVRERTWDLVDANSRLAREMEERGCAENAMLESERRFQNLVENALVGVCIVKDGKVVYSNPMQSEIFGDLPDDFDITSLAVHREDEERFRQCCNSMIHGTMMSSEMEMRLYPLGSEGEEEKVRHVHCHANRIQYQGGSAFLINMMDLTRAKALERVVQVREKMASLGNVAAGIAHEIRNPLSGINVLLDGIEEGFEDPENVEDIKMLIEEAKKASYKIACVIKRVLDFSKPSRPELRLTSINGPIGEAVKLVRTTSRKSGVTIETDLDEGVPLLYIDEHLVEEVILNMINNASEAVRGPKGPKCIKISSSSEDGQVLLRVSDSGPGVPEDMRKKIFDPFFTTRSDGSGIGLGLCQRIISDHGGTIDVSTSEELGGAEFRISLPLEKRAMPR